MINNWCSLYVSWCWSACHIIYFLRPSIFRFAQQIGWFVVSVAIADLQAIGTSLHASPAHRDTTASVAKQLGTVASFLLQSSLQPTSIPTYNRAWKLFHQFFHTVFQTQFGFLPISLPFVALFIAYLFNAQYASSTVTTYTSLLGCSHKLMGFADPCKVSYVSQLL